MFLRGLFLVGATHDGFGQRRRYSSTQSIAVAWRSSDLLNMFSLIFWGGVGLLLFLSFFGRDQISGCVFFSLCPCLLSALQNG